MRWLVLFSLWLAGLAGALSLNGTAGPNLPAEARLGVFLVGPSGSALSEFASAPIQAGRFSLTLPEGAPDLAARFPLRRENITWPSVLDPVSLSREVSAGELRAYVYTDSSGDGRFERGEPLTETPLHVGRDAVVLVWVDNDTRVQAARGFEASLRRGWNALSISPGKAVKVSPYAGGTLNLTVAP